MSNIRHRSSTLIYEVSNRLSFIPSQDTTEADKISKASILNGDGKCEYCGVNPATTLDHYHPLVRDSKPTKYCNDFWNIVPCCGTCNSSKGNRDFWEWFEGTSKQNPFKKMQDHQLDKVREKFTLYDEQFEDRHYEKTFPEGQLKEINESIGLFLQMLDQKICDIYRQTTFSRKT